MPLSLYPVLSKGRREGVIASYASLCLSGEKLYTPVCEVVEALEFSGLQVVLLTLVMVLHRIAGFISCATSKIKCTRCEIILLTDLYFFVTLHIS